MQLFTSGEARWLGIQVEAQSEQPRVLRLSVRYALKAADAEKVGGVRMAALGFLNPLLAAFIHVTSDFGLCPKFHKVVAAVIGTKRVC